MTTALQIEDPARSGDRFDDLVTVMQAHFGAVLDAHGPHLFTVDAGDLVELYLHNLPADQRQHHTCHACKTFLQRFGSLAVVDDDGTLTPAVWPSECAPEPYTTAIAALARAVRRGTVSGVALHGERVWGTPLTGEWTHFAVTPPRAALWTPIGVLTAGQTAAAKREDYGTLQRGLAEFTRETVAQALTLLEAETLYRSEKVLGPAKFLMDLHEARARVRGQQRENVVWRAVAGAPPGFCTPRSTMVGTLLSDIAEELDFAQVKRRFAEKMHPLQYQRPTAAPAAGNIAAAEKLVETLGIASALRRRFARLDEIQTVWRPEPVPERAQPHGGVFSHLLVGEKRATTPPMTIPAQTVTWEKFARTVLPFARRMDVYVLGTMNFCALLTAADPESVPILQWDSAEVRNPVSWYVYNGGSSPEQWSLRSGTWIPVTAVALQPSMWAGADKFTHQGKSALFILDGARDTKASGLALFPETLQSSLHAVRSVIEAHSRTGTLEGREEASACGLRVGDSTNAGQIRVTSATGMITYRIDRWD